METYSFNLLSLGLAIQSVMYRSENQENRIFAERTRPSALGTISAVDVELLVGVEV